MKLYKNLIAGTISAAIALLVALKATSQETCVIWQAQGSECDPTEVETTLRAPNTVDIIAPNHGNVLQNVVFVLYNSGNTVGEVKVSQNGKNIFSDSIQPGLNQYSVSASSLGTLSLSVINGSFSMNAILNVAESIELPAESSGFMGQMANIEFLIKSEFYGEAYVRLHRLQNEYPESYEVWAATAVLHHFLGNVSLCREAVSKAIFYLPPEAGTNEIKNLVSLIY